MWGTLCCVLARHPAAVSLAVRGARRVRAHINSAHEFTRDRHPADMR